MTWNPARSDSSVCLHVHLSPHLGCAWGSHSPAGCACPYSGINSGHRKQLPARVQEAEPFGAGLPGPPVPSSDLQAPDGMPQSRRGRLLAPSIPSVMVWVGTLVTKSLPSPLGHKNPPLLSLGYPVVQRASLEADLDILNGLPVEMIIFWMYCVK